MSKITTISIDIETDKLPEFYISLVLHKASPTGDMEALQKMANAIHFDHKALLQKLQLSEAKKKHLEKCMLEIHAFLHSSKRDSAGYLEVSKESLEKFKASAFGKDIENKFYLLELSLQWTGKADSMEVQVFIALYVLQMSMLIEFLRNPEQEYFDPHTTKYDIEQYKEVVTEFNRFLRLPKGKREQTGVRDEVIIDLYKCLTSHYPNLTVHVSTTITGYIASRMGLLDTLELSDETDRIQPYRKYLRDAVYNILRSHHLVKKM